MAKWEIKQPIIKWDPITREENSWLIDFLRKTWEQRHSNLAIGKVLNEEDGRKMFMGIYNKLAHEEWKFEQMAKGGDKPS